MKRRKLSTPMPHLDFHSDEKIVFMASLIGVPYSVEEYNENQSSMYLDDGPVIISYGERMKTIYMYPKLEHNLLNSKNIEEQWINNPYIFKNNNVYKLCDFIVNNRETETVYDIYSTFFCEDVISHSNRHHYEILLKFFSNHYSLLTLLTYHNNNIKIKENSFFNQIIAIDGNEIHEYVKIIRIEDIIQVMIEQCNDMNALKYRDDPQMIRTVSSYLLNDCLFLYNICNESTKTYIVKRIGKLFWDELLDTKEYNNQRYGCVPKGDIDTYLFLLFSTGVTPKKHGLLFQYENSTFHRNSIINAYQRYVYIRAFLKKVGNKKKMPELDKLVMEYLCDENYYEERAYKNEYFHKCYETYQLE